ncbi:type II toxin-antitoxin system HipA family toxin [Flavobacterium restrictum]|uniref:Type II toxin-antitoxin system HipA family toxin n=1 Tax=Flavobacterium restrictum TaxID=2594428 RepID=A0A553DW74_9FLAO|nr:type II toxin-antitoxin system HipA family toxin [Flavobacterium restrictum]TRX37044.1 type II toxin-antitoxin system HipA family toxin [Flavobacterium restrictum]
MVAVADVKIWGNNVGVVLWDEVRNYGIFEFDKSFLKLGLDLSPISLPLAAAQRGNRIFSFPMLNPETFKGLPGLLSDSLPDKFGNQIIDAWLAQQGKNSADFNPVDRLCYIGKRGMGALEFEPANTVTVENSNPIQIQELVQFAKAVLDNRNDFHTNLDSKKGFSDILQVGSSAGGARAKAVIAYNKATGEVRSGQVDGLDGFEYWLIKFDGVTNHQLGDPKGYGNIEYAYYLMAVDAGISMSESRLMTENNRSHFMTKRFDRQNNQKIHMQTLCGIAHFDYNQPRAYSYEQAFQVMRQMKLPYSDMEELYRRMVFNVMARNQDDHTKNISFLMFPDGQWQLSPAYDITYAYNPDNFWLKAHQMSVNGKREAILLDDLLAIAKSCNIKKPKAIIALCNKVMANWTDYASKAGIDSVQILQIQKELIIYTI